MSNLSFNKFMILSCCLILNGCIAVSQRKSWTYQKLKSEATTIPYISYIKIDLTKDKLLIPTPIIMAEINSSKEYLLNIDCITDSLKEYRSLDSIRYTVRTLANAELGKGILPIQNGEFRIRSYSYGKYRAQCATEPKIKLGKQKQSLVATFIIYATDSTGQPKTIGIDNVGLYYHKPRVVGFF